MIIGVILRSASHEAYTLISKIEDWAKLHTASLWLDNSFFKTNQISPDNELTDNQNEYFSNFTQVSTLELFKHADVVITLGGDGTLLSVVKYTQVHTPKFVAINFGHLGFLTEIARDDILSCLDSLYTGTAQFDCRSLLTLKIKRTNTVIFETLFLNDAVLQKASGEQLINVDVKLNGEDFLSTRGDGIIIATPTGSTAYSLSAGGAIVHPTLQAILITPICPHSLTSRPVVLPQASLLSIDIPEQKNISLVIDGQETMLLSAHDHIEITGADRVLRLVKSNKAGYFQLLRNKLNWGMPNFGFNKS